MVHFKVVVSHSRRGQRSSVLSTKCCCAHETLHRLSRPSKWKNFEDESELFIQIAFRQGTAYLGLEKDTS